MLLFLSLSTTEGSLSEMTSARHISRPFMAAIKMEDGTTKRHDIRHTSHLVSFRHEQIFYGRKRATRNLWEDKINDQRRVFIVFSFSIT
jgi:hypothetical protein